MKRGNQLKSIYIRQNEEKILLLQFLSAKTYNRAASINMFLWILSILSALFLPSLEVFFRKYLGNNSLVIPLLVMLCIYFLEQKVENLIILGADTKELIDRTLFGFESTTTLDNFSKDEIVEAALKVKEQNKKEYKSAIRNTGKDKPKGVRNWYSESNDKTLLNEIFHCQKENRWYDNSISTTYTYVCLFVFSIVTIWLILFFKDYTLASILFTISSYSSLILKLYSDVKQYRKVKDIHLSTETLMDYAERNGNLNEEIVKNIQSNLYQRRKINYVPLDIIHSIKSIKLHKLWEEKTEYKE